MILLLPIHADLGNIDQVIINLALNARDAMPEGGTLRFETNNMTLDQDYKKQHSQGVTGNFVRLTIGDTGSGMSTDVQERIFEPFFTTKTPDKGTGLGLAVVYGIIQEHQGWIEVESAPGEGTRFEIYLPALDNQVEVEPRRTAAPTTVRHKGNDGHIMLVEDEADLRERTERVLVDSGYVVHSFSTIAAARTAFEQTSKPYDLILSDAVLPDGMGPHLVLDLCAEQANLAALIMTGYTDERID